MPIYHFTLYADATKSEDLGYMPMADDAEALAFARRIIRELMQRYSAEYAGSSMHITEGERAVSSIPFDFEADTNHQKENSRLN
jgi:hypothetical protein